MAPRAAAQGVRLRIADPLRSAAQARSGVALPEFERRECQGVQAADETRGRRQIRGARSPAKEPAGLRSARRIRRRDLSLEVQMRVEGRERETALAGRVPDSEKSAAKGGEEMNAQEEIIDKVR